MNKALSSSLVAALACAAFLLSTPAASAAQVVSYALGSDDIVDSDANFLRDDETVPVEVPWNLTDPLSNSTLYDTSPGSATFYGGVGIIDTGETNASDFRIDDGNPDYLRVGGRGANYAMGLMWLSSDFSGGAPRYDIDSSSSMSVTVGVRSFNVSGRDAVYRWMFLQDGTVYVSDAEDLDDNTTDGTVSPVSSGDLTLLNWNTVDLAGDMFNSPVASATPDFTDIEGLGIYIASGADPDDSTDTAWDAHLFDYSADVTAIPEPGAFTLLLLGLSSLLFIRRRG